jgi:4-hydroxy-L-threonine phosphate dehydrogenase PdxA
LVIGNTGRFYRDIRPTYNVSGRQYEGIFFSKHVLLKKGCDLFTKDRIIDYVTRLENALSILGVDRRKIAIASFLRTSVDHGTVFDNADKGLARSISMEEAIRLAVVYGNKYSI